MACNCVRPDEPYLENNRNHIKYSMKPFHDLKFLVSFFPDSSLQLIYNEVNKVEPSVNADVEDYLGTSISNSYVTFKD